MVIGISIYKFTFSSVWCCCYAHIELLSLMLIKMCSVPGLSDPNRFSRLFVPVLPPFALFVRVARKVHFTV